MDGLKKIRKGVWMMTEIIVGLGLIWSAIITSLPSFFWNIALLLVGVGAFSLGLRNIDNALGLGKKKEDDEETKKE